MQLLQKRLARAPITYNQLADALEQPRVTEAWRSHPFCEAFDIMDKEDAAAGRPFRTALVFNDKKNMPGEGFFNTLQKLREVEIPKDEIKRQAIYMKELGDAIAFYGKTPIA